MRKEFTQEEKREYFKGLRDRWAAAKSYACEDEVRAIIKNHGLNISITGYCFVASQMKTLGYDGLPYLDMKTYQGWKDNGFIVCKGQKSNVTGLTWIGIEGKEGAEEGAEKSNSYVMPKAYHLFHRSQVQAIA